MCSVSNLEPLCASKQLPEGLYTFWTHAPEVI